MGQGLRDLQVLRGPEFSSLCSRLPITQLPGDPMLAALLRDCTHGLHRHSCRHMHLLPIHKHIEVLKHILKYHIILDKTIILIYTYVI